MKLFDRLAQIAFSPVDEGGRFYTSDTAVDDTAASGVASRTVTASGQSAAFNITDRAQIDAKLNITAISGTGASLQLALQVTDDGTNWYAVGGSLPVAAATAVASPAGEETFQVTGYNQARWAWTVAGTTPSVTFNVATTTRRSGDS